MIKEIMYSIDDGSFFKSALEKVLLGFAGLFVLAFLGVGIGLLRSGGNMAVGLASLLVIAPVTGITLVRAGSIRDVQNDRGSPAIPVVAILFKWAAEISAVTIVVVGLAAVFAIGASASSGVLSDFIPLASEMRRAEGMEALFYPLVATIAVLVYGFVTLLGGHVTAEAFGALIRIADNSE